MRTSSSRRTQASAGRTLPIFYLPHHRQIVAPHTSGENYMPRKASPHACNDESLGVPLSTRFAHGKSSPESQSSKSKPSPIISKKPVSFSVVEHLDADIKCKAGSLPSYHNIRGYVTRPDPIGSSKTTTQTTETARTSKDKGKSAAFSLSGPSISISPAVAKSNINTFTANKYVGATSKEIAPSQLISDTSGKLGSSYCFAMGNAVDMKSKVLMAEASKFINDKFVQSYMEKELAGHIRAEEETCDDHLPKPVGTRCQLCNSDLAFTPETCESFRASNLPPVAVLACGHCYHNSCIEAFFGPVEPPCITCLGC